MDFVHDWKVWDAVPISEVWAVTGQAPLQGKLVDVNKGDLKRLAVRGRYVAKEFAKARSDDFFAAAPPSEALRMLLSHEAACRSSGRGGRKVLVVDTRKGHLHAPAEKDVCVALPLEARVPGMLGGILGE